ncbi:DUF6994 family protein [Cyanobium sp. ATX 6F1]|uniref:DUF6994 family protein n=1 Tax=unclassified Cyanobium TaxID=2627006 RepID=UPI0020CE0E86|nr:hypothetical protein [Cyanobium sp. ATX 6F1]MCP9915334.1 hypothetical protein [Cyanobium sp. ATX 6F1]
MRTYNQIDVTFDFRSDTPGYPKKDPDSYSPALRRHHRHLWSKHLPNGVLFTLDDIGQHYLHHRSGLGEFFLASDAVIPTFRKESRLEKVLSSIPTAEQESFLRVGYTIGGMMVFPAERVGRKMTINGARGFHPRIKDRFDLTVECIRRHYRSEPSPLGDVLQRYGSFLGLFGDFRGYVEFFLLQDLVTEDCSAVRFFSSFMDFNTSPVPQDLDGYLAYRQAAIEFIESRNRRIYLWSAEQQAGQHAVQPTEANVTS